MFKMDSQADLGGGAWSPVSAAGYMNEHGELTERSVCNHNSVVDDPFVSFTSDLSKLASSIGIRR
jgi:hypothetical protein